MGGKHNMLAIFNHLCFLIKIAKFLLKIQRFKLVKIDYFGLDVMDYLHMKEGEI